MSGIKAHRIIRFSAHPRTTLHLLAVASAASLLAQTPPRPPSPTSSHSPDYCAPRPLADFQKSRVLAEKGDSAAQESLGFYYQTGTCTKVDHQAALHWYSLAAEQNNPSALEWLGLIYRGGDGVQKDESLAFEYFRRAAEQGSASAMSNVAMSFKFGQGVEADIGKSVLWYERAASAGDSGAMEELGELFDSEDFGVQDYQKAFSWHKQAASKGNTAAAIAVAEAYARGRGTQKDPAQAFVLYKALAGSLGRRDSAYIPYLYHRLAEAYCDGDGTARNFPECFRLATLAANGDEWRAQVLLGSLYEGLYGAAGAAVVKQSLMQADKWYTIAINHDSDNEAAESITEFRRDLEARMTDDEITESVRLARIWKPLGSVETTKRPVDESLSKRQQEALVRVRCREIYRRTSVKTIASLTVVDAPQVQACQTMNLYPPR